VNLPQLVLDGHIIPLQFRCSNLQPCLPNDDPIPKGYQWSDAIDPPLTLTGRVQQDYHQLLVLRHVIATAIFNTFRISLLSRP
jgi:hypothetical protein